MRDHLTLDQGEEKASQQDREEMELWSPGAQEAVLNRALKQLVHVHSSSAIKYEKFQRL
jgi:hypothetical protein